jgi:leucyl-tRNA synthetase
MRALRQCGYVGFDEPFTGLLAQGMVCHETYKDADGKWLHPEAVTHDAEGVARARDTGAPVVVGRSEKMSKSRHNVVDPEEMIALYGADTARLFMLSDSPPKRDLQWTEAGIEGAWRYAQRLWRLVDEPAVSLPPPGAPAPNDMADAARDLRRTTHKTIAAVTDDIEKFGFNRAVARIRELSNAITAFDATAEGGAWALREALETLVQLLGPMMPHLAEELWAELGHDRMLAEQPWPEADAALTVDESVTVAVQVNGKLRATLRLAVDTDRAEAESQALADPAVIAAVGGKPVRKVVVVPNRVVNVVV